MTTHLHWGLRYDPFHGAGGPFVATPGHEAAVRRVVEAIEARVSRIELHAGAGLGKTMVVEEALTRLRHPLRRTARSVAPGDGPTMLAELATRLGVAVPAGASRGAAWKGLADALRLCRVQGLSVVVAVEDAHWLNDPADLERLAALGTSLRGGVSILATGRPSADGPGMLSSDAWYPRVDLLPLTRTEADAYLRAKLAAAGRGEPLFTPRCVSRIHAHSRGVPGDLDRLAAHALSIGAARQVEMIGSELVETAMAL